MRTQRLRSLCIALVTLFGLCLLSQQSAHAADIPQTWKLTGFNGISTGAQCIDPVQPHTFVFGRYDQTFVPPRFAGYSAFDWQTSTTTPLNGIAQDELVCGSDGMFYANNRGARTAVRFSRTNPQPQSIAHMVTHPAQDGTSQVYFFNMPADGQLWASPDNGTTWQRRDTALPGQIASFVVSPVDARAIYALAAVAQPNAATGQFTLYFSSDAGATWQARYSGIARTTVLPVLNIYLHAPEGRASINALELGVDEPTSPPNSAFTTYITVDGGRTFLKQEPIPSNSFRSFIATSAGLLRSTIACSHAQGRCTSFRLERFSDSAGQWQPLPASPVYDGVTDSTSILVTVNPYLPTESIVQRFDDSADGSTFWRSADGGLTWQKIISASRSTGDSSARLISIQPTPYLPLTLLGYTGDKLYTLDVADVGKNLAAPFPTVGAGVYFPQTQHNMSPLFSQYWTEYSGLAQFGYPKTEAFRELNPADNHIYVVQYFERARMEYHPEAPQEYRVLLGLLGNQLTAARKAAGEGAFNRFQDMHYPGGTYFPQTGHNLRNDFKKYWEARGGLAIYGYPTSEEFYEVNPDDGKTYVVQYFERNRFEYHPENTGTPYVVLLGLLGNQVLHDRGWL